MADVQARNVIFFVSILVMFSFLVGLMPVQFYMGSEEEEYYDYNYPSFFTPSDIEKIKYYDNATLVYYGQNWGYFDLGSEATGYARFKAWFTYDLNPPFNPRFVKLSYITWYWWIFESSERCHFEGKFVKDMEDHPERIRLVDCTNNWDSDYNSSRFTAESYNSPLVQMWITDTNTTRNDITEAWVTDGNITVTLGMGFTDFETKLSSWSILASLLTYQDVRGLPNAIAYPISTVIWAGVAYCVYCLILKVIPLID
jgi:hypothetical protein